jgi:uncharacterized protein involved in response to NO
MVNSGLPSGVVTETTALAEAPWYRREPYLVFFPLGVAMSWAGVAHWLLHALGLLDSYRPIFHAMVQIQCFMMSFATGFLLTMIPRRTGSAPPSTWEVAVCATAPIATAVAAWNDRWIVSQAAWLVLAVTLIQFAVRRFTSATARRRPPNAFVWIPLSLLMGIAGSLMTGVYGVLGVDYLWVHEVGRRLLLQGMFTGLVLGVGSLAFPLMTRGEAPSDAAAGTRDVLERAAHALAALVLVSSFFVETFASLRVAMVLRAAVATVALLLGAGLWRLPSQPGWNRRLIWLSGWMLPLGFVIAAAFPDEYKAGLHVTFLGGFATLALGVSTQVVLGHRGYRSVMNGRPWQVPAVGGLMLMAVGGRVAMEFDRVRYFGWMAVAAAAFLAATSVWLQLVVPKMLVKAAE